MEGLGIVLQRTRPVRCSIVLAGGSVPTANGAPGPMTGASYEGTREVGSGDLVQVKLRYEYVDAGTTDAALEVAGSLAPSDVATELTGADLDLQWASAIAAFSEVLKGSPYASSVDLDALEAIFEAQSTRDAERTEFYALFVAARALL